MALFQVPFSREILWWGPPPGPRPNVRDAKSIKKKLSKNLEKVHVPINFRYG